MNLVDSSGWMEYFVNGPQSHFFAEPLKDVPHLIVPTICFYEVFKKTLLMCNEEKAFEVVAAMGQGQVIPTHTHTHTLLSTLIPFINIRNPGDPLRAVVASKKQVNPR